MKIHLLDMGDERYGDCVVVRDRDLSVLIDGGHINDHRPRATSPSLPEQLEAILGSPPPFRFDLLVVTHCHGDHIGCLPTLVADQRVTAKWALLAHEDLGYPDLSADGADATDDVVAAVVAALREEPPRDSASDADIQQFISDAVKLPQRYRDMIDALSRSGTKIVRFAGTDDRDSRADLRQLTRDFQSIGLEILGPTNAHLLHCAEAIATAGRAATDAANGLRAADRSGDAATLYRHLSGLGSADFSAAADASGNSAAVNNQSIIVKVGRGENTALLTGDMQFADSDVPSVDEEMSRLFDRVAERGPYAFVKIPHHAAHNGFDDTMADAFDGVQVYGVTTGRGDAGHPNREVLEVLEGRRDQIRLVRTDKNGLIALDLSRGEVEIRTDRGEINDFTINADVLPAAPEAQELQPEPETVLERPPGTKVWRSGAKDTRQVEVHAWVPHTATRVTITIDVEPKSPDWAEEPEPPEAEPPEVEPPESDPVRRLAAGRTLPRLLFVTHMPNLEANIRPLKAREARRMIQRAPGQTFLDIRNPADPFPEMRQAIATHQPEGVVVLGGYDVLKSLRIDALPPRLRSRIGPNGDHDDFIVWSDHVYGDRDGDLLAEIPVSRIPDGKSADLVFNALTARAAPLTVERFGIRNVARPFAGPIFDGLHGNQRILVSEPTAPASVTTAQVDARLVYIMLHGSDADGTRFWGERRTGGAFEALNLANIPNPSGSVALAGCCWGALPVATTALRHQPGAAIRPLEPQQSIALSFIGRGARAFVGCTGSHYSPVSDNPDALLNYFGAPMHEAFWRHIKKGEAPARALFNAKIDYIAGMPHGRTALADQAIEHKILNQFTCLGLGW